MHLGNYSSGIWPNMMLHSGWMLTLWHSGVSNLWWTLPQDCQNQEVRIKGPGNTSDRSSSSHDVHPFIGLVLTQAGLVLKVYLSSVSSLAYFVSQLESNYCICWFFKICLYYLLLPAVQYSSTDWGRLRPSLLGWVGWEILRQVEVEAQSLLG